MTEHRSDEKRIFSRITFDASVRMTDARGEWQSSLQDISLKGALVKIPSGWQGKPGDKCRLRIILLGGDAEIDMEAAVAHIETNSVGFRCEGIDSDSAAHLRRLIELNLGDEALLDRELAALGGNTVK
jgi:hypothetical protein